MAETIDQTYVDQFESDVIVTAQQKKSRLRNCVSTGTQKAEKDFVNRIGEATARKLTSRHADTVYDEVDFSRRMITLEDYAWAKMLDKQDSYRMLIDAKNPYTQAGSRAMGKAIDDEIILAMQGSAYSGKSGSTAVPFPDSQRLLAYLDGAPSVPTRMNVDTLVRIKGLFWTNEVDLEDDELYIAMSSMQLQAMLRQTEVGSSDYNSIKALVEGKINTFMGFTFVHTERIESGDVDYTNAGVVSDGAANTLSSADKVLAWAKSGVRLNVAMEPMAKMDELPQKNYATQIYFSMGIGATRLEEEKVIEIACKPTA